MSDLVVLVHLYTGFKMHTLIVKLVDLWGFEARYYANFNFKFQVSLQVPVAEVSSQVHRDWCFAVDSDEPEILRRIETALLEVGHWHT